VAQRPLRGEPLALDLVDTEWYDGGARRDDLADDAGGRAWLAEHGYADGDPGALRTTRSALRRALEDGDPGPINAVLARGRTSPRLGPDGPTAHVEVQEGWRAAWDAAVDLLRLLGDRPDRVRRCAHPACVLWFHDTSRNGTRRWCAMGVCGNRAKAGRYYERTRGRADAPRPTGGRAGT
jgi:hypothetical protein